MKLRHRTDDKTRATAPEADEARKQGAADTEDALAEPPTAGPKKPTDLTRQGWLGAFRRTFRQFSDDELSDRAAALTYYGVLSIFPGALVLVSILGLLSDNGRDTVQDTINELTGNKQMQDLAGTVLKQVTESSAGEPHRDHRYRRSRSGRRPATSRRSCAPRTPSTTSPRAGRSGRPCRSGSASPR